MSKFDQLVEDYSTSPVPEGKTVSGFRVALIILGVGIALPAFLNGAKIGDAIGLENAAIAFLAGGVLLTVLGSLTAIVSTRARLTTYMLVQYSFGTTGARLVNFILATTMFGWFGVNAALFGQATLATLNDLYGFTGGLDFYIVAGSVLMVLTTMFGFKALDKLALFAVPLLIVILVAIVVLAMRDAAPEVLFAPRPQTMTLGYAISATVGANMVTVATMPDIGRYVSSKAQAIWGAFLAFTLGGPVILLSAAIPSLATGESDLMLIILGLGLGLPALAVLIFSTWTTNAANLYGAGLSLAATFRRIPQWQLTIVAGVLGAGLAVAGIIDLFIPFLITLGITIPPVAAVYVIDGFYRFRGRYDPAALTLGPAVRW